MVFELLWVISYASEARLGAAAAHGRYYALVSWRKKLPKRLVARFLSSNSNIGAVVRVVVTANGRPVADIPPVFGFSLIGSIKDMCDGASDSAVQS